MIDLKKRIFITGVTGFVGANIAHQLISLGAQDVHVLVREGSNLSRINSILSRIVLHTFSLENREETSRKIHEIQPQIIFHIAALGTTVGRVPLTMEDLISANVLGTVHLIDAAVATGTCEIFVNTGSSSEYGIKDISMSENDVLEPVNLYGISKAAATNYATLIGKQKKFPIVTYRIFSAYGPYEDHKRLISTLLRSYICNISPELSSPLSVRDFIYIGDIVSAFLLADNGVQVPGDIINLGTGIQYSIGEVVDILQNIFDTTLEPKYGSQPINQIEPKSWVANSSKMKKILDIEPRSLKDGLLLTREWILHN